MPNYTTTTKIPKSQTAIIRAEPRKTLDLLSLSLSLTEEDPIGIDVEAQREENRREARATVAGGPGGGARVPRARRRPLQQP